MNEPIQLGDVPRRSSEHRVALLDDRLLLLHPATGRFSILSGSAHRIYDAIDATSTVGAIATTVAAEVGLDRDTIVSDVLAAVTDMAAELLIAIDSIGAKPAPVNGIGRQVDDISSETGLRKVRAGATVLGLRPIGPELSALLDGPLALLPTSTPDEPVDVLYTIHPSENCDGVFEVYKNGFGFVVAGSAHVASEAILAGCNQAATTKPVKAIRIHGGVAAADGQAVVVCGESGTGKSTLTAALVMNGWQYLTDEVAVIHPSTHSITPYPKWIDLSTQSLGLLGLGFNSGIGPHGLKHHVPPLRLGRVGEHATVKAIVVLSHTADSDATPRTLTHGDAVAALLGNVFAGTWEHHDALQAVVDLCAAATVVQIPRLPLGEMVALVNALNE